MFDFKTQDEFKKVEFWVERYENGVLIDRPSAVNTMSDELKPMEGQVAVVISSNDEIQFSLTMDNLGTRVGHTSVAAEFDNTLGRGASTIGSPVTIEDGKEIVLYSAIYSSGEIRAGSLEVYKKEPDLLKDYPLAYLVKCKFSS